MAPFRTIFSLAIFAALLVFAILSKAEVALMDGWDGLVHFFRTRRS